jgi:hypothetical protein
MSRRRNRATTSLNAINILACLVAWLALVVLWGLCTSASAAEHLRAGDVCQVTYLDGTHRRAVVQQYALDVIVDGWVWVSVDDPRHGWFISRYRVQDLRECGR